MHIHAGSAVSMVDPGFDRRVAGTVLHGEYTCAELPICMLVSTAGWPPMPRRTFILWRSRPLRPDLPAGTGQALGEGFALT
jgi:hypothetical protein